jgi:hypothetical protein
LARGDRAEGDATRPRESSRGNLERGYSRSRERNEAARARLKPLAPGERPLPLRLAAALALLIAVANVVALAAGVQVQGQRPVAGALLFAAVMALAAVGMWQRRYWAVLGFEALLGLSIVYAAISLMLAGNLLAVALCLAVIAVAGPLFWLLIRVMARIQMPRRPPIG